MKKFFKDNREISSQIIRRMASEAPRALDLWLGMKDICNGYGICVASQIALEHLLHVKSRMTVYKAVQYLNKNDYIKIAKIGNQNAYILNPNIVQTLPYNRSTQALSDRGIIFKGSIELTKEENPKFYREYKKFVKHHPAPKMKSIDKIRIGMHHTKKSKSRPKTKSAVKSKKSMKVYSSKSEAKRHNGYYQQELIENNKTKKPVKND